MLSLKKTGIQSWMVFILATGFLFYQYTLFVIPVVMLEPLIKAHRLNGMTLGFLVSAYFYGYLFMQIPAAILIDRFGAVKSIIIAITCCATGTLLFSNAQWLWVAFMGRIFMGCGAAFAATGYMKLISIWFSTRYFPMMATFFGIACMAGAGTAETPLSWLVQNIGWQVTLWLCSGFGLILSLLFLFFVKNKHQEEQKQNPKKDHSFSWSKAKHILKKLSNLALILYSGLCMTPLVVFAGLWGVPALKQIQGLSNSASISIVSFSFFGFVIGGLFLDSLLKKLHSKWPLLIIGTTLAWLFLLIITNGGVFTKMVLALLVFCFGLFSSTCMLGNDLAKGLNAHEEISTLTAIMNLSMPFWVLFTEPILGKILDQTGFNIHGYKLCLNLLGAYFAVALLAGCLLKGFDRKVK